MTEEQEMVAELLKMRGKTTEEIDALLKERAPAPDLCQTQGHIYDDGECERCGERRPPTVPVAAVPIKAKLGQPRPAFQPSRPKAPRGGPPMLSPKQASLLRKLATERGDAERIGSAISGGLSSKEAHDLIDELLATPKLPTDQRPPKVERVPPELGYYEKDGQFYLVVDNLKGTGRYAKKRDADGKWQYDAGMSYRLTPADKLTLEQAERFGLRQARS
jgi:hypothetical protein